MKRLSAMLGIAFALIFYQPILSAQDPMNPLEPDTLLSKIKSYTNAQGLLDSLNIIRNDFTNENYLAYQQSFEHGIAHYKSIRNDTAIAHLEYMKSHLLLFQANYPEALISFNEDLELYQELALNEQIGRCYYNIAWIHHKQKNYQQFLEYAKLASRTYKLVPENKSTCLGAMTLGIAYYLNDSLDRSLDNFRDYYMMASRINDIHHTAQALSKLGTFYAGSKHPAAQDSARKYYTMEWEISRKDSSGRSILLAGIDMGSLERENKNYSQSLHYFDLALEKAKQLGKYHERQWIERTMAEIHALAGNYKNAFQTFVSYSHLKDSIFSDQKNLQVTELEKKYETARKDNEIALLASENEVHQAKAQRQATLRNALIGGLVLLGIIGTLIFQRMKSQKLLAAKNEEVKVSNLKEQLKTLEMKALRAQMNPHFLFNSLNSINRMIKGHDNDNASIYLAKFSKLVRLMLENSEQSNVSLQDEIQMLESYIQLESLRFKNKIDYEIAIAETIDKEDTLMPSMVLQPFVENAIWHGLMHKDREGLLTIDIQEQADHLKCRITDNGVGREVSKKLQEQSAFKKKSMGIQITAERLKLLTNQKIKEAIKIVDLKDDENKASGTEVNIAIPIS